MASDDNLRNTVTKINRLYTEAELALFAGYVEQRASIRPAQCSYVAECWVSRGPPCYKQQSGTYGGRCLGCDGQIR